jgi:alanine racemase
MGRIGFAWETAAAQLAGLVAGGKLEVRGLCTHFASADSRDRSFADEQFSRFERVLAACAEQGITDCFRHASNSGGLLQDAAWELDGVRPGILLYGYGPRLSTPRTGTIVTRPFLQWKTRVVHVKRVPAGFRVSYDSTYVTEHETCIATLDVGYADGYPRLLSNRGVVLVGGRRVPVAGRVTMNLTTVDVGPEARVAAGDEAVLLGTQGGEAIWADELADRARTISYEILTNIRASARRV